MQLDREGTVDNAPFGPVGGFLRVSDELVDQTFISQPLRMNGFK